MDDLGELIKQQRLAMSLTLRELSAASDISASHLGRIERGDRFPSARTLRKIAQPLGFEENRLFILAGFLPPTSPDDGKEKASHPISCLDPDVVRVLAEEPVEVQRCVIGIISIIKSLAKSVRPV